MTRPAALLAAILFAAPAAAEQAGPPEAVIVAMAQHFVQEQFMHGTIGHYHIEFDLAILHPQPQPGFWAVVGGFVSDQNTRNHYVAAVRLICGAVEEVACWRLEKLAINGEILLNESPPL